MFRTGQNWDRFITTFEGDNAVPLLITDGDTGIEYSDSIGNFSRSLLSRLVDLNYRTLAPYVNLNFIVGDITVDASVRQDEVQVRGTAAGAGGFLGDTFPCDTDGDGDDTGPLDVCSQSDLTNGTVHDYDPSYTSYSVGANWDLRRQPGGIRATSARAVSSLQTGCLTAARIAYSPPTSG